MKYVLIGALLLLSGCATNKEFLTDTSSGWFSSRSGAWDTLVFCESKLNGQIQPRCYETEYLRLRETK
jgi:hypothetical protein